MREKRPGTTEELVDMLQAKASETNRLGQARFGITPANNLGVSMVDIRQIAREFERSHELALELWETGMHEARIMATILDEPAIVTKQQMDRWAHEFDSWDICDQACGNLFDKTPYVITKSYEWTQLQPEFVRRAGFVLMAYAAVHDKRAKDQQFIDFLPTLVNGMTDERNFVKKAISWSFRQIGKRNVALNKAVLKIVEPLWDSTDKTTRWIARDVVRELQNEKTLARLKT